MLSAPSVLELACVRARTRPGEGEGGWDAVTFFERFAGPTNLLHKLCSFELRFTAGRGSSSSVDHRSGNFWRMLSTCGPPLVWRARKPLPSALRSSAALALGLAPQHAPVPEHVFWFRVCDCAPNGCSLLFSISLLFLLVHVALKLRSLRFHSPRLSIFASQGPGPAKCCARSTAPLCRAMI